MNGRPDVSFFNSTINITQGTAAENFQILNIFKELHTTQKRTDKCKEKQALFLYLKSSQ
jgi:hypothetical protein